MKDPALAAEAARECAENVFVEKHFLEEEFFEMRIFGDKVAGKRTVKDPALAAETGREEPPGPARRGERLRCVRAAPASKRVVGCECVGEGDGEGGGGLRERGCWRRGESGPEGACQQSRTMRFWSVHWIPTSRTRLAQAQ